MNQFQSKKMIILFALVSITACNITTQDSNELVDQERVSEEQNNGGEQQNNDEDEEYYGVCNTDLIDMVREDGIISVIVDLKMEDYISEHELSEEEIQKQRKAVAKLQEEFLKALEGQNFILSREGNLRPWFSLDEVDEDALLFICKNEMVKRIHLNETYSID